MSVIPPPEPHTKFHDIGFTPYQRTLLDGVMGLLDDGEKHYLEILGISNLNETYRLGFDKLREYHSLCQELLTGANDEQRTRLRGILFQKMINNGEGKNVLSYIKNQDGVESPMDSFLKDYTHRSRGPGLSDDEEEVQNLLNMFFDTMANHPDMTLDNMLKDAFERDGDIDFKSLELLLSQFGDTDPSSNPIIIDENSHPQYLLLHLTRVSTNEWRVAYAIKKGLDDMRRDYKLADKEDKRPIRAISWLFGPKTEKTFADMGMGENEGVRFYYPDMERIWKDDALDELCLKYSTESELIHAAVAGIFSSRTNMKDFVLNGKVPSVGIAILPNQSFFRSNS